MFAISTLVHSIFAVNPLQELCHLYHVCCLSLACVDVRFPNSLSSASKDSFPIKTCMAGFKIVRLPFATHSRVLRWNLSSMSLYWAIRHTSIQVGAAILLGTGWFLSGAILLLLPGLPIFDIMFTSYNSVASSLPTMYLASVPKGNLSSTITPTYRSI